MTSESEVPGSGGLDPEDEMRADLYALLARLFYAPPDATILGMIMDAPEIGAEAEDPAFAKAWARLVDAARDAKPEALGPAYDELFVGVAKPLVTPYLIDHLGATGREKLLVRLRDDLRALGLARAASAGEPEDHVAGLFDAMRHLASSGSGRLALVRQRDFFQRHLAPAFRPFCAAIVKADAPPFYAALAALTKAFLAVEEEALAMV